MRITDEKGDWLAISAKFDDERYVAQALMRETYEVDLTVDDLHSIIDQCNELLGETEPRLVAEIELLETWMRRIAEWSCEGRMALRELDALRNSGDSNLPEPEPSDLDKLEASVRRGSPGGWGGAMLALIAVLRRHEERLP
jgi:hypothetical protein